MQTFTLGIQTAHTEQVLMLLFPSLFAPSWGSFPLPEFFWTLVHLPKRFRFDGHLPEHLLELPACAGACQDRVRAQQDFQGAFKEEGEPPSLLLCSQSSLSQGEGDFFALSPRKLILLHLLLISSPCAAPLVASLLWRKVCVGISSSSD